MCAIVDANVASEVFGSKPQPAGELFFDWINVGSGRLVTGGKQLQELQYLQGFREWAATAVSAGKVRISRAGEVDARSQRLRAKGDHRSDDPHVLALAQLSGARLLYSNDIALQQDFKDKALIDTPRGRVYSTLHGKSVSPSHRALLKRNDLCAGVQ